LEKTQNGSQLNAVAPSAPPASNGPVIAPPPVPAVPSPPINKVVIPSPPMVIIPPKADLPSMGQPPSKQVQSPPVVPKTVVPSKGVSLLDMRISPKSFKEAVTGTAEVKKTVPKDPESPQSTKSPTPPPKKKASRKEKKLREDPVRLKWIARREALEDKGADLSCISVGRPEVKAWCEDMKITGRNLYVVWRGRKVGAFVGWEPTKRLVSGYKNAGYKKAYSEAEAVELLEENM